MQKQYRKRTTLRSESSTIKGLLYAPDPEKREKATLSDATTIARHIHGASVLLGT